MNEANNQDQLNQATLFFLLKHKNLYTDMKRRQFVFRMKFKGKCYQKVRSFKKFRTIKDCDDFISDIHKIYDKKDSNWDDIHCGCLQYIDSKQYLMENDQNLPNEESLENDKFECINESDDSGHPFYGKRSNDEIKELLWHKNLYYESKNERYKFKCTTNAGETIQRYYPIKQIRSFPICNKIMEEVHNLWARCKGIDLGCIKSCGCQFYKLKREQLIREDLRQIQYEAEFIISHSDNDEESNYGFNC